MGTDGGSYTRTMYVTYHSVLTGTFQQYLVPPARRLLYSVAKTRRRTSKVNHLWFPLQSLNLLIGIRAIHAGGALRRGQVARCELPPARGLLRTYGQPRFSHAPATRRRAALILFPLAGRVSLHRMLNRCVYRVGFELCRFNRYPTY